MQPSVLFADESVLFVIHQLTLLNTEQFSLKVHSLQGDRNPCKTQHVQTVPLL